jgi:hypothetical protein
MAVLVPFLFVAADSVQMIPMSGAALRGRRNDERSASRRKRSAPATASRV